MVRDSIYLDIVPAITYHHCQLWLFLTSLLYILPAFLIRLCLLTVLRCLYEAVDIHIPMTCLMNGSTLAMSEICCATETGREFLGVLGFSSNFLASSLLINILISSTHESALHRHFVL